MQKVLKETATHEKFQKVRKSKLNTLVKFTFTKLIFAGIFLYPLYLPAMNGILSMGYGPRNRSMGGANGAAPVDTSTILVNPAGMTWLPTSCDFALNIARLDHYIDTSGASGTIVNEEAGRQYNSIKYYPFPFAGMIYNPECSSFSFGILVAGIGGGAATYKYPRTNPTLLLEPNQEFNAAQTHSIYDTEASSQTLQTGVAVAYRYSDRLSIGACLNTDIQFFASDSLTSTPTGFVQTNGRGRSDIFYGIGLTLGGLYAINSDWSTGLTLVSPQWFEQSKLYKDLIPKFKLPPQIRLGVAFHPSSIPLLVSLDVKWLGWKTISPFKRQPANGGLGWKNQYILGLGLQYTLSASIMARCGYNYGKAPINGKKAFANALIPVFAEHHLCFGLEYELNERNTFALSAVYDFRKTIKDNGKGDVVSQLGKGTRVSTQSIDLAIGWTLKM